MTVIRSGLTILLSAVLIASVYGQCPQTADECVDDKKFNKLSQGDPSFYCEEGAKLVAEAQNLLRDCKFSEDNSRLKSKKAEINSFCFREDNNCPNVTDTFVAQTRCYDPYGGLDNIIDKIIAAFESGASNFMDLCNPLYWGRYCQKTQICSFNQNLDFYLINQNKPVGLGLAVCGSETLKTILQYLEESSGCPVGNDMDAEIRSKCDIACDTANALDEKEYCILLEKQASCLQDATAGCSSAERKYVKPRLNTYAVANKYLSCNIKYNGITVKPSGRTVEYSALINQCTFSQTTEPLNLLSLQQLFNFDTPYLSDFCKSRENQDKIVADCRNAFLAVATPQFKLLSRTQDDLNAVPIDFVPQLGAFPVDSYATAFTYKSLPDVCPNNLQWSDRICVPNAEQSTKAPEKSTKSGITPPPKTTPAKATTRAGGNQDGDHQGEDHGTSGPLTRAPAEDYVKGGSSGSERVAVAFAVLLICSALTSLINA